MSNLKTNNDNTHTGMSNLKTSDDNTHTGMSNLKTNNDNTHTGMSNLKTSDDYTHTGMSNLKTSDDNTHTGMSNLRTNNEIKRIVERYLDTQKKLSQQKCAKIVSLKKGIKKCTSKGNERTSNRTDRYRQSGEALNQSNEKLLHRAEQKRLSMKRKRDEETEEEKEIRKEKDRLAKRQKRLKMNEDEIDIRRKLDSQARRKKRNQEDSITKTERKKKDREARKEKRNQEDSVTASERKKKVREANKEKRNQEDSVTASERKKKVREANKEKRNQEDSVTASERKKKVREANKEKRNQEDSVTASERKKKVREANKEKRNQEDSVTASERKKKDRKARKEKRNQEDSVTASERKKKDRETRKEKRNQEDSVTASERKKKVREANKEKRNQEDSVTASERKKKVREANKEKRNQEDSVTASERKKKVREANKEKRNQEDSVTTSERKKKVREANKEKRNQEDSVTASERKKKDREARKEKRNQEDSVTASERKKKDREARKEKRGQADSVLINNRRHADREYKKLRRKTSDNSNQAIKDFKEIIQNGPFYICTVCQRFLYKGSVKLFHEDDYCGETYATSKHSFDDCEYICLNCHKSVKANKMPAIAVLNGLQLDEIPSQLETLNSLECVFIARRIPFMKVLALPRGKQKAIHGCVVNVPIEPEHIASVLPRVPSSETFITVKVKRKLHYRGHVFHQTVRPDKVLTALFVLKNHLKNPLYSDVVINNYWNEDSERADENLWTHFVGESQGQDTNQTNETVDEDPVDEHDEEEEDERSRLSGLPFDSTIQPKDIVADQSHILNIAPGEGKTPKPYFDDEKAEELSFPQLFPRGRFGYSHNRNRKITLKQYFQSRILNCDQRFSRNIDYIFFAQYRCEAKEVNDNLSISLRKGKSQDITAGQIKEKLENLVQCDLGIHFLQKIRGSPSYFNKLFYDLLGMIRQLGPCTWFITLSAADLKWPDTIKVIAKQQGASLTDDDILHMSWEQKCHYLRTNPVTAARHFDNRVQMFLKHILLNNNLNPLGEITDYKYRIEFQHRGSPHVHMLAWVKDAPSFENNDEQEIEEFIDGKISCQLPADDQDMYDLLHLVQRHTHSVACKKHGKNCRFNFPRPPVNRTLILKPLEEQPSAEIQTRYSEILTAVNELLGDPTVDMTLEQVLKKVNVTEELYYKSLHWIKTKSGQPAVLLKRTPYEVNVNNYNKTMMSAWEANLDVQFVTNVYSCVMYLASYISKPEKTLGDVLKAVSKSASHLGLKKSMKSVAHKFLTHREVSAQEAVYRLLSLPLTRGSRQIVFIPTDLPENRTRLFKSMTAISRMDDDDPDVYVKGLLDKYAARPNVLEDVCLAEFAAEYRTSTGKKKTDDDITDDIANEQNEQVDEGEVLQLKNDLGTVSKRRVPTIIRSHKWSVKKNPEQFFHAALLLYFPWRNEVQDLLQNTYQETYEQNYETISERQSKFEHHTEEIADVLDDIQQNGFPDDSWANVAPQNEQQQEEDRLEGCVEEADIHCVFNTDHQNTVTSDLGMMAFKYDASTENMSSSDWLQMICSLNQQQYIVHRYIVNWATRMLLSHRGIKTDPFHLFLTGGAGVGKSFLVRTIVQTVKYLFARNNQVQDTHVLVCAPTGAAAYNISGHTCHSAFQLQIHTSKDDDYYPLSSEKLSSMKESLCNIKLVVIDEISMVSADMLLTIHRRLCDVMGNLEPFGGVSILAVGDLLQLPPVAQKPVYSLPSDDIASIYGSLWTSHFKIAELTELQRQKNDENFAALLNRIRIGKQTTKDLELLQSRQISSTDPNYPMQSTHMFTYNSLRDEHNNNMLEKTDHQVFVFKAKDTTKDEQTQRVSQETASSKTACGLLYELKLSIDARVVLTKNIDVSDGLVNSAAGIVKGFIPSFDSTQDPETFKPKYILIKFDEERVGKKCRLTSKGLIKNHPTCTPIPAIECPIYFSKRSKKVSKKRTQFPIDLAWGVTIHKEQGKTEDHAVVCCNGNFNKGQFYTAVSRTKTLDGLHFTGQVDGKKIKTNTDALKEIQRMKVSSELQIQHIESLSKGSSFLKLQTFNINSLKPHFQCYIKDNYLENLHIICIQETWLKPHDSCPSIENFNTIRQDSETRQRHGGLLMYIHHSFRLLHEYHISDLCFEYQMVLLSPVQYPDTRLVVVSIYNNPRTKCLQFLKDLERLLQNVPLNIPVFVVGDFNITTSRNKQDLTNLSSYYGLRQLVTEPTHRQGGTLDLFHVNKDPENVVIDVIPTYYTDHLIVSAAVPLVLNEKIY